MTFQTLSRESSRRSIKEFPRSFMVVMNDAKSSPDSGRRVREAENSCVTNYCLQSIGKLPLSGIGSSLSIFCHLIVALEWLCKLDLRAGKRAAIRNAIVVASPSSVSFRRNLNCGAFGWWEPRNLWKWCEKKFDESKSDDGARRAPDGDENSLLLRELLAFAPIFHSSTLLQMGS